jgi:predicted S18 family serine protease
MVKFKFLVFFFVFLFLSSSLVFGAKGDITLLTVGESPSGSRKGGTADISLEVSAGSGKIFINSFPFTREDTQVSVRFAKDVACNFLEVDCSLLDFFYSINIGSSSVGGPSAGAAIAILTISVLNNEKLSGDVVITGTINSGGIIGPVSGLEEKAIAARNAGFSKILVPSNSVLIDKTLSDLNISSNYSISNTTNNDSDDFYNESNLTIFYADSLVVEGIDIVPVSTLEEALFEFTGKTFPDYSHNILVPSQYQDIMMRVSEQLCERSYEILGFIPASVKEDNEDVLKRAEESIQLGVNASESSDYYSAASFCFSANSALRSLEFESYSDDELLDVASQIRISLDNLLSELNSKSLKTISDLETYIIVKERLFEAESLLDEDDYLDNLGYIMERRYSAIAWSSFFEFKGREVILDDTHLANACIAKISEAEERLSYIDFFSGLVFDRTELNDAKKFHEAGDYAFCIFRASKVKADANAIILSMSLSRDRVSNLIDDQLTFARMQINKQGDNFPILGYSYYNYASTLRDSRPQLSMVFAEYASEFSNLDMYFPSKRSIPWSIIVASYSTFFYGLFFGFVLCVGIFSFFILSRRNLKKVKKSKKKK